MLKKILPFFLLALGAPVLAQEARCQLTSPAGASIPYASVHFPAQQRGVLTDVNGTFTLDLQGGTKEDTIAFSCLNYVPEIRTVEALRRASGPECRIVLQEDQYQLQTAEVVTERLKLRQGKIGVTSGINTAWFDFRRVGKPIEIGTIIEVQERCRIDEINIKIKEVEVDSFLLEVNLYDYPKNGDAVGSMLLREREFHTIRRDMSGKTFSISIAEQNIWVDDNFLVAFRMLDSGTSPGYVKMAARTKRGKGLRTYGDGQWSDPYIYPAIWTEVSYVK